MSTDNIGVVFGLTAGRPPFLSQQLLDALDADLRGIRTEDGSEPCRLGFVMSCSSLEARGMRETLVKFCKGGGGYQQRSLREYFMLNTDRFIVAVLPDCVLPPPDGTCTQGGELLALAGGGGQEVFRLSLSEYLNCACCITGAQWVSAPFECVNATYNAKHSARAVERTIEWTKDCLQVLCPAGGKPGQISNDDGLKLGRPRLLAPVVGLDERSLNASVNAVLALAKNRAELWEHDLGIAFPNLLGLPPVERLAKLERCLTAIREAFPGRDILSFVHMGSSGPVQLLETLALGVTVVESSLPYFLTKSGHALLLPINTANDHPVKQELNANMRDPQFALDKAPLVTGCECFSCRTHTRGYLHHLLVSREMVGEMLLFTHNAFTVARLVHSAKAMSAEQLASYIKRLRATYCQ